jgi:molecular chaperone GrpE (heat shock protein)
MRAVKAAAPKNGEADYTVLETLESGLFFGQRILRKQSVVIIKRSQSA